MLWCADCCNKRVWKRKKIYKWESRFIKGKKVEIMKVFSVVLLILSVFSCRASDPGKRHVSPAGIAPVVVPVIPSGLSFAGEQVPLQNYDTRESMEEELSVTMYMHSRTMKSLRTMERYFTMIEPILEKNGIPDDFKYLAVAESNLDPEAYSPAKAAGLWQIMASTATELGLEVNNSVDERYQIEKATEAACKYLQKAYERFGTWTMAAASYNVGMAGVARRIASQNISSFYDLLAPSETMRYVFRILSFKIVSAEPKAYGFMIGAEDYYKPYEYTVIEVKDAKIDWTKLAQDNGTNYKILRELNPWIRGYEHVNRLGKTYRVKIPVKDFRTK